VSYTRQELITIREYLGSVPVFGGFVLLTFLVFCVVLCFVCLHVLSCVFNVTSVSGLSILYCLWFSLTFIRMRRKKLEIVVDKLKVLYIPHLVNPRQLFFKNTRST